jgi:hypothetical protein
MSPAVKAFEIVAMVLVTISVILQLTVGRGKPEHWGHTLLFWVLLGVSAVVLQLT